MVRSMDQAGKHCGNYWPSWSCYVCTAVIEGMGLTTVHHHSSIRFLKYAGIFFLHSLHAVTSLPGFLFQIQRREQLCSLEAHTERAPFFFFLR